MVQQDLLVINTVSDKVGMIIGIKYHKLIILLSQILLLLSLFATTKLILLHYGVLDSSSLSIEDAIGPAPYAMDPLPHNALPA